MDKNSDKGKAKGRSRTSSLSLSERGSRAGSPSESSARPRLPSATATTKDLCEESNKMQALAKKAADKAAAHQRKMTDYVAVASPGGAGELGSGPRDPVMAAVAAAAARQPGGAAAVLLKTHQQQQQQAQSGGPVQEGQNLGQAVDSLLKESRQQRNPDSMIKAVQLLNDAMSTSTSGAGASGSPDEEDGEGWQVWTNRKNRRIGGDLGQEEEEDRRRRMRGSTPFQIPGAPTWSQRGYYTSTQNRNLASVNRGSRTTAVARLTDQQWFWFKRKKCLGCGEGHQVKDCPVLTPEEGKALLRAVFSCPADMRPNPGDRSAPRRPPPPRGPPGSTAAAGTPASAPAAATASTSSAAAGPPKAAKRDREKETTGLTPEAKKAKMFSEAVKSNLTLFVREKDGAPLSKDRFLALKTSFTYYVEDMLAKNKDPPMCSGRWQESRSVVRIPMASEDDLLWMRCFLDKSYLVQSEKEFQASKNRIYVAFLRDRLEPELTNMRQDKLANFIKFYRRQAKIDSLFELKMAAKTTRGKAIHLVMDEEAEAAFVEQGCKIPFAAAGWISFEERSTYVARIKAQEKERLRPKASRLERGQAAKSLEQMKLVEVVDLEKETSETVATTATTETETATEESQEPSEEALQLGRELRQAVRDGSMEEEAANSKMLEKTGLTLAETLPRRTVSGSSWSEEVEHMKKLTNSSVPAAVVEEEEEESNTDIDMDDDRDHAQFELRQEQDAQFGHRAAGSGAASGRAAGSLTE